MKPLLVVFLISVLLCSTVLGDGSFARADIEALLTQQPVLHEFIATHLETTSGGLAGRINTGDNPALAGTRIGPYRLNAKPRGATGDFSLTLSIEVETRFLNSAGKEVPLAQASRIEERFTGISLLPR